ncbi:MAG: glycosyltransferase [Planctomycetes bacterium]|nr:glycosyltransferase [Planctomycetota bacterium]MCP4771817.1 glycosyltransferase [Planctomycetota bacterium]MCP4860938.1 glycosyltransferase [Planctomycetota bacterium]
MRIAVLLDHWHRAGGGLEQYLKFVLPRLVELGHEVLLVAAGASRGTPPGVESHELGRGRFLPRPWSDYAEAREAVAAAKAWRADATFSPRAISSPGCVWQPMGGSAPHVQAARGRPPSLRTRALMRLENAALQAAHTVFVPSPMVGREIRERAAEKKQVLAPLPLLQEPLALRKPVMRRDWQQAAPLRVVHCGRDPLRHGSATAVEWFLAIRARKIPARLDLWSKTKTHAARAIGKSVEELNQLGVTLHDWDGGFHAALAKADLLLHPTLYDSFSLVCLEAAAAGVPVATTQQAGVAELLPEHLCVTVAPKLTEVAAASALELLVAATSISTDAWRELVMEVREQFSLDRHVALLVDTLAATAMRQSAHD